MGKLVSRQQKAERATIATNLRSRIEAQYPNMSWSDAQANVGRAAGGLSFSTVQRVLKGDTGPSVDTITALCVALGCTLHDVTAPVINPVRRQRVRQYVDMPLWPPGSEPED